MTETNRNVIAAVSARGLALQIDGQRKAVSWRTVIGVSAGRALHGDIWILVLAIEIEIDDAVRSFLVGEVEPAWPALTAILPTALPEMPSFEYWGPQVIAATAPLSLYARVS